MTLLPVQIEVLPLEVIIGVAGFAFTVTVTAAEADVHPDALLTVTE